MSKTIKDNLKNKVVIITLLLVVLLVIIAIPTFCQLLMTQNNTINYWDGFSTEIFQSGTGTSTDPYIISNPNQLAYLKNEINSGNTYENTYFRLNNDLYLNHGVIKYQNGQIIYINNTESYYIKPYTNEYYQEVTFKNLVGTINSFESFDTFKGHLDGQNNTIYGLYLTSNEISEIALFNNLEGTIKNLTFSSSLIYGTHYTGLINNTKNSTITNLIFNGTIITNSKTKISKLTLDNIESSEITSTEPITVPELPLTATIEKVTLSGTFSGESIYINDTIVNTETFEITSAIPFENLNIISTNGAYSLTNLVYQIFYTDDVTSLIVNSSNSTVNSVVTLGNIIGHNITSGLVGIAQNNTDIINSYNNAIINGTNISAGLIGFSNNSILTLTNTYNSNTITAKNYAGGLIGYLSSESTSTISNSLSTGSITADNRGAIIGKNNTSDISTDNNYYTLTELSSIAESELSVATYKDPNELLTTKFLIDTLNYHSNTWNITENNLPTLQIHDTNSPTINLELLETTWDNLHSPIDMIINQVATLSVKYEELDSDILTVEYFIDNHRKSELDINTTAFNVYQEEIILSTSGYYTIYFKVTDSLNNIAYANTDTIILDGYSTEITDLANNYLSEYKNQITSNSSIKYHFKREISYSEYPYTSVEYYLKSNHSIPKDTIITLIDNIKEQVYVYTVVQGGNSTSQYSLKSFKALGQTTNTYFNNSPIDYYLNNTISEDFEIILDFKNTKIKNNQEYLIDLVIIDNNKVITKPLENQPNNSFTIIKVSDDNTSSKYNIELSTNYEDYLDLSTIQENIISLTTKINFFTSNDTPIFDSTVNFDNLLLNLHIEDSNRNIINNHVVKGITAKLNHHNYYAKEDGTIQIPTNKLQNELIIAVNYLINDLPNGVYYLKINSCLVDNACSNELTIPVHVDNSSTISDHELSILLDSYDRMIIKNKNATMNNDQKLNFTINYSGQLTNPNIHVKLYKKLNFSYENQIYELVRLTDFVTNELVETTINSNEYYLMTSLENTNNIDLDLLINNFQYGSYKLVFYLYDDTSYITEQSITILIK